MSNIEISPVGEFKILQVLELVNGENHRYTLTPNDDLTDQSDEVKEQAELYHTPEVKEAYTAFLESFKKP